MTTAALRKTAGRRLRDVVADLFSLGGRNRPYPAVTADDLTKAAWEETGKSLQSGMDHVAKDAAVRARLKCDA
ncbi:hypothetical protein [Komagataeibacter europaeus]|uniref:hypothetical protein n=1 Tax=Komagataeibacter europaeus TaxID=33995 RepID=UPI0012DF17CA|nr:hypothetical protein [Komagataeibacter europaeus]